MGYVGFGFQVLGLLSGLAALGLYAAAFKSGNKLLQKYGDIQRTVQLISLIFAVSILLLSIFSNDFNLRYVAIYSDRSLPVIYKLASLWSGSSGSILSISFAVALFIAIESYRIRKSDTRYRAAWSIVSTAIVTTLLVLPTFVVKIFTELDFTPIDGAGLPPAFQNINMVIYPAFAFVCISSVVIIFSHMMGSLIMKDLSSYWVQKSRQWAYVSWIAITGAIFSSAIWSFTVLRIGGFWRWDPLETAMMLIWISITGFLHVSVLQIKKGNMKISCRFYAFTAFAFIIGAIAIVHGSSGGIIIFYKQLNFSMYLLAMIIASLVVFLILFIKNNKALRSQKLKPKRINENIFNIFNIIVFGIIIIFFITFVAELIVNFNSAKVSVCAPIIYKSVCLFSAMAGLISLILISANYIFKKEYLIRIKCLYPLLIFMVLIAVVAFIFLDGLSAVLIWPVALLSIALTILKIIVAKRRKMSLYSRVGKRFLGGAIAHIGFALLVIGVAGSSAYYKDVNISLVEGVNFDFQGYNLLVNDVKSVYKNNYVSTFVDIRLLKDGKYIGDIFPEIRSYKKSSNLAAEVGTVFSGFSGVSVAFLSYDFNSKEINLFIMSYPFAVLIFLGAVVSIAGMFYAIRLGEFI